MKKIYLIFALSLTGLLTFGSSAEAKVCHSHKHSHLNKTHAHRHCHSARNNHHRKRLKKRVHHRKVVLSLMDGKLYRKRVRRHKSRMIAAHPSLPVGTKVMVTNPRNNKSVILTITDKMRSVPGAKIRNLKISKRAAIKLGLLRHLPTHAKLKVL